MNKCDGVVCRGTGDKAKICNPATGKCVLVRGAVGAKLLGGQNLNLPNAPPSGLPRGMMQRSGTCWFNAAFNGVLLSARTCAKFLRLFRELTAEERQLLHLVPTNACPRHLSKVFVLGYLLVFLTGRDFGHRNAQHIEHPNNSHPKRLIGSVLPWFQGSGTVGFDPIAGILSILDACFQGKYYVMRGGHMTPPPAAEFLLFRNPSVGAALPLAWRGFELCHVSAGIRWERGDSHAVLLYRTSDGEYLYDSNASTRVPVRWTSMRHDDLDRFMQSYATAYYKNLGRYASYNYSYAIYVRTGHAASTSKNNSAHRARAAALARAAAAPLP